MLFDVSIRIHLVEVLRFFRVSRPPRVVFTHEWSVTPPALTVHELLMGELEGSWKISNTGSLPVSGRLLSF